MRHRLIAGHLGIALIIVIGAATSVIALRWTASQAERAQHIDARLVVLDSLRSDLRELGFAVRAHLMRGDVATQQRVFDILQRVAAARKQLQARDTLANGAPFEADIEDYVAALLTVMSRDVPDPMARIVGFEETLTRVRGQLTPRFDEVIRSERARRDSAREIQTLATRAQWAIAVATCIGMLLVVAMARHALRQPAPVERLGTIEPPPVERVEPSVLIS